MSILVGISDLRPGEISPIAEEEELTETVAEGGQPIPVTSVSIQPANLQEGTRCPSSLKSRWLGKSPLVPYSEGPSVSPVGSQKTLGRQESVPSSSLNPVDNVTTRKRAEATSTRRRRAFG